jgi:hypothetical protein
MDWLTRHQQVACTPEYPPNHPPTQSHDGLGAKLLIKS